MNKQDAKIILAGAVVGAGLYYFLYRAGVISFQAAATSSSPAVQSTVFPNPNPVPVSAGKAPSISGGASPVTSIIPPASPALSVQPQAPTAPTSASMIPPSGSTPSLYTAAPPNAIGNPTSPQLIIPTIRASLNPPPAPSTAKAASSVYSPPILFSTPIM